MRRIIVQQILFSHWNVKGLNPDLVEVKCQTVVPFLHLSVIHERTLIAVFGSMEIVNGMARF